MTPPPSGIPPHLQSFIRQVALAKVVALERFATAARLARREFHRSSSLTPHQARAIYHNSMKQALATFEAEGERQLRTLTAVTGINISIADSPQGTQFTFLTQDGQTLTVLAPPHTFIEDRPIPPPE